MIVYDGFQPSPDTGSKMMIYSIHQLRVLALATLLTVITLLVVLLLNDSAHRCVQVSVQQWRPHAPRGTHRVVQALAGDHEAVRRPPGGGNIDAESSRILLPSSSSAEEEEEEEDEDEELGNEDNESDEDEEQDDAGDEYDDIPENKVFEDGDFDYNDTDRYGPGYLEPDFGVILRMLGNSSMPNNSSTPSRNITLVNIEGVPIVEDGIFWSDELERRAPKGATDAECESALKRLRSLGVQRVEPPSWNRCGRPKNQFVVFEDGSKACARYRAPHQYLVQGEVLSFYLSRLLGVHNVPVVSLTAVKPDFVGIWSRPAVREELTASGWQANTTVALIQWIEHLERDKLPPTLLSSLEKREPLSAKSSSILRLPTQKLTELLQWSDLILFDYITGNYDRVASMQDAAEKERKPSILRETVHNLVRSKSTGGLWLIDNESGLLDSYSLLYGKDSRFVHFHQQMLDTICLFRRSTVDRIRWLHHSERAGQILAEVAKQLEPLLADVDEEHVVAKRLQQRIAEVYEHAKKCSASLS